MSFYAEHVASVVHSTHTSITLISQVTQCINILLFVMLLQAKERTLDYDLYCLLAVRFWSLSEAEFKLTDKPGRVLFTQVHTSSMYIQVVTLAYLSFECMELSPLRRIRLLHVADECCNCQQVIGQAVCDERTSTQLMHQLCAYNAVNDVCCMLCVGRQACSIHSTYVA